MAYHVIERIPLDGKWHRYRVYLAGGGGTYIDVGSPFSWNEPTWQFETAVDTAGGPGPEHIVWVNLNPSSILWGPEGTTISKYEPMNPVLQKIDLDGSHTVVRTYLCGTFVDPDGNWEYANGDQYVDVIASGGVFDLHLHLWQRTGKGGPKDKDYYMIWISNYPSSVYWYGDVTICGWEILGDPNGLGPRCWV